MSFPRATTNTIGITQNSLLAKTDRSIIRDNVNSDITTIDQKITQAHAMGHNKVVYELRTNYIMQNFSKIEAQTLVYSELIRIYKEDKGFTDTYIEIGEPSKLHISWLSGMDEDEKKQRMSYIADNSVKNRATK